jgi:hypothetical protein
VLSSGGGDGGEKTGAEVAATGTKEGKEATASSTKQEQKPTTLTAAELIAKADKSCERAKDEYVAALRAFGGKGAEEVPNLEFAERLVGISSRQVTDLEKLVPPKEVEKEFDEYLSSRRRVAGWDEDALTAAEAEDAAAYQVAYENRTNSEPEREALADKIGFKVCSQPQE